MEQVRHLNGGEGRVVATVPQASAGALQGLLLAVSGQNAKDRRHARLPSRLGNAQGRRFCYIPVVVSLVPDDGAQANDSIECAFLGKTLGRLRDLEGAGHPDHCYVLSSYLTRHQPIYGTLQ